MPSPYATLTVFSIGLAILYFALQLHLRLTQDSREPVAVETTLPYITPTLGLSKNTYFAYLRKRFPKLPIFTLRLPGQRIYVIQDAQLITAIQRQYKIINFQAIQDHFSHRLFSLSPKVKEIQKHQIDTWRSGPAHMPSPGHVQFKPMAPGDQLDHMNQLMLKSLEDSAQGWVPQEPSVRKTKLFEWVKEAIFVPTTDGVYGPENPYRDSSVRKEFWTFFRGMPNMVKGLDWLVKDSVAASRRLGATFEKYFQQGGHEKFSGLANKQFHHYKTQGYPLSDLSQLVAGSAIAVLGNTLPAACWFVFHLYSDCKVYEACREEILAQVVHTHDENGNPQRKVDVTALKVACPLLNSVFKEVLRVESIGFNVRVVEDEHLLDGKYLLRKGGLVFIPLEAQHFDQNRWGADAEDFCYDRFTDKTRSRVPNVSFRAFGGGTTLCPGRHFVTTELLAFAAMLLLRCEIVPKNGQWVTPTKINADMSTNVPAPDFDIDVEIRKRADDEGVKWVWVLSESEHAVMLGDQDEHGNEK